MRSHAIRVDDSEVVVATTTFDLAITVCRDNDLPQAQPY